MLNRFYRYAVVVFLFLTASGTALAALPLSFTLNPAVNNMALGQVQLLEFEITNNLAGVTLPLKNISIVNDGDTQSAGSAQLSTECGTSLAPGQSCSIAIKLSNLNVGNLKRHLAIEYNGRAPLVAPLDISIAEAKYTVLIYIVGSNLESSNDSASVNIEQMTKVGSTENLNVIIETGGADKPGWLTVKRQQVIPDFTLTVQNLGVLNMALTSTIEDFIQWGVTNYPAEKYMLIFWDHGGGINGGYGGDENFNNDGTSVSQLKDAVQQAVTATGKQFEIIGFDTCLLANSETVAALAPYTHYIVASEDSEPGAGWQYNTFLNLMNTQPESTGLQIGTEIVNGYTAQNQGDDTTLSVMDATQMPAFLSALSDFSNALEAHVTNIPDWKILARNRLISPDFSTSIWIRGSYDLVDFTKFVTNATAGFSSDSNVQQTGTALLAASQNVIKYFKNSPSRSDSLGLQMYYPSLMAQYNTNYPTNVTNNGSLFFPSNYLDLVNNYVNFYTANVSNLVAIPNSLAFDGTNYTAQVSNDYDSLYATAGNDSCTVFNSSNTQITGVPCYGAMQFTDIQSTHTAGHLISNISFNKNETADSWPLINGQPALLIPEDYDQVENENSTYIIPVSPDVDEAPGFLEVVLQNGVYNVIGFQRSTGSSNSQTKVTPVKDGTTFYLNSYALNGSWGLYRTTTEITAPFTITMGPVPSGFNAFRFLVGDLTGALNVSSSSVAY